MTITQSALGERAMLVSLPVSIWSARKHDVRISDKVAAEHGADRSMGRYAKHLIPRDLLTTVNAANTALRDHIALTPRGGGGTAFRPVFDWIAGSDIQPVCAIYLTDLDGDDFGPAPDYPVLWVSTGKTGAPFGEVIPYR